MPRRAVLVLVVTTSALLITSCKSSSKSKATLTNVPATAVAPATTTAPAPAASSSATPLPPAAASSTSASAAASVSAPTSGSGVPTNLDPCQLVTQAEASALAGATFGPGREETAGSGKECIYGYQTTNVMDVIVTQAPDAKTAQAAFAQGVAEAQSTISTNLPPGITVKLDPTNTAGIGDNATTIIGAGSVAGQTISFTGIYVLSGATFFTIGDLVLTKAPPTAAAVQAQAKVTVGRI
jgi:hypothetical protein